MWRFLLALVALGAVAGLLAWLRPPADRARVLKWSGLGLMAVFTLIGSAWIAAEAFTDPGGWQAVGLVAAWLAPMVVLLAIAWFRVDWATTLLGALTVGVTGACVWFAADPGAWRTFENDNGPVRAVTVFALAAPAALLGWHRLRPAGVLLVVLGVVPFALSTAGDVDGLGSLSVVSVPPLLAGACYLLADAAARRTAAAGRPKALAGR